MQTASSPKTSRKQAKDKQLQKDTPAAGMQNAKVSARPRRIKMPTYHSLRLQKRIKHPVRLPSTWRLTKQAAKILWGQKKLFIEITLLYGVLNLVLVQGLASSTDVGGLKDQLGKLFSGNFSSLTSSLTVFLMLVGSSGNNSSNVAGAYQFILVVITSLAIIWALRQVQAGITIRVRDAYYRGMYPLVPFILVLCVIGLELLPLIIGTTLYNIVLVNGIAVYPAEKIIWGLFALVTVVLSLYMISSALFALYIVTLPDMAPMKALRSARELVRYRRWTVLRKLLFLPPALFVGAAIIMVPIILFLTPLAQWVFFILSMFALTASHAYIYTMYRELLRE